MFELIRSNRRRSAFLVAGMAGLLLATGYAVGETVQPGSGLVGLACGLGLWALLAVVGYSSGDSIFLGLAGARRIQKEDHPVLFNAVEEMCIAAGLARMPAIYVIDQDAPNAFATGRGPERASLAVTAGLLERLDRDELQGVVAHELAHVQNRDVLFLMMLGAMAGAVVILADLGRRFLWVSGPRRRTSDKSGSAGAIIVLVALMLMILAPLLAQLLYLAVSRRREYLADACGAQFTRYPEGLASALEKIGSSPSSLQGVSRVMAPMYTHDPFPSRVQGGSAWGSTHPPIAERIRILRSMAGAASLVGYDEAFRTVTRRPVGVVPARALAEERERAAARPARTDPRTRLDRVRETTDVFWRLKGYAFLPCTCGTNLKVPPAYKGQSLVCPHCGRPLQVPA